MPDSSGVAKPGTAIPGPVPSVIAVTPAAGPELAARLAAQERAPDAVLVSEPVLTTGLQDGLGAGSDWIWVVDGSALPRPEALARLVDRAADPGDLPGPDLLSSAVLAADGSVAEQHAPWFRRGATDLALRAALVRLLPVRATGAGSLLVRADAVRAAAPPLADLDGRGAALEWTGRLLRRCAGYLVPASVAHAARPESGGAPDVKVASAMLPGGGW